MPAEIEALLRRLIGGDVEAASEILRQARTTSSAELLVAAALITPEPRGLLARAAANAVTTRDRQLVAVAGAHLGGDVDLLDVLVREHLSDHPDNILVSWIAAHHVHPGQPTLAQP